MPLDLGKGRLVRDGLFATLNKTNPMVCVYVVDSLSRTERCFNIDAILLNMKEYQKDFDNWNERKKNINSSHNGVRYFKEREIWWTSIGVNIGSDIDGKNDLFERPVLIIKKLHGTKFFGITLTTKAKTGSYFLPITHSGMQRVAVFIDAKVFSSQRLVRKID